MFVCTECFAVFDEPKKFEEHHGLDSPPYEITYGCPYCGGNYQEAIYCDNCGEIITNSYVEIDDDNKRYCDCCFVLKNIFE